jgi:hypothetical protein
MSMGRGGVYGDPRTAWEKEQERRMAGLLSPDTQAAVDSYASRGLLAQQEAEPLLGDAPEAPKGFWQGGRKFTGRDAIAGILATLGDAIATHNGRKGTAFDALTDSRTKGYDAFAEAQRAYQRRQQIARLPGMTAREMLAYDADPKAWGGHMADAISTHQAAANVNPGEQRLFGNPNMGGSVYQAPTAAEQYAASLGEPAGTQGFRAALQDYVLRANGPTAYGYDTALDDHRTANNMGMEGLRQQNRIGLEGVRQGNRMGLRGSPTYRDLNPPAPRAGAPRVTPPRRKANPTATGKNGEKYEYNGKQWVRIN